MLWCRILLRLRPLRLGLVKGGTVMAKNWKLPELLLASLSSEVEVPSCC